MTNTTTEASKPAAAQEAVAYNAGGIEMTACQLHEALLMAGSPELDVEFDDRSRVRIFRTDNGHSGPGLYCECVDVEEEGCILLDGTSPAIAAPVAAAPVDGDFDGASYKRMFIDACSALAEVSRELGVDPEQGGAEPILAAIAKLKASTPAAPGIDLSKLQRYRMASSHENHRNLYQDDTGSWVKIQDVERTLIDASPKGGSTDAAKALRAAVAAIYFDDSSDYQSALWEVARTLNPEIAALLEHDPEAAMQATSAEVGS